MKRIILGQRARQAFSMLLLAVSASWIFPVIYNLILGEAASAVLFFVLSAAFAGLSLLLFLKIQKNEGAYPELVRDEETEAFFHIPLQQYRTAYELYAEGSPEVTYYFGENAEKMINKVCCSDYPSCLFDRMKELQSTKAVFCGHDHYNNMSLEYQGIRLTYGMSIDYLAMPGIANDTKQRGGTLITIGPDGSFGIEQIPYEKIQEKETYR